MKLITCPRMCGRYRLTRADRLAEKFAAVYGSDELDLTPRYNIAPTQAIPVIRVQGPERVISALRWGLVPSAVKDASAPQINARSETLVEKPRFRQSFERRRCLIPADGFYEWKRNGRSKQAFHFGMKDGSLFAFAGVWDRSQAPGQPAIESCAILTTAANELLEDVHDRMPVILASESYDAWLSVRGSNFRMLMNLLVPFNSELMRRWPVGPAVNDPRNESPVCSQEVAELMPAQAALFH